MLLVTDGLFRSRDILTRKKYVKLVEDVQEGAGVVHIFSSLHPSGEQLEELAGIAGICRFPLADIDEIGIKGQRTGSPPPYNDPLTRP